MELQGTGSPGWISSPHGNPGPSCLSSDFAIFQSVFLTCMIKAHSPAPSSLFRKNRSQGHKLLLLEDATMILFTSRWLEPGHMAAPGQKGDWERQSVAKWPCIKPKRKRIRAHGRWKSFLQEEKNGLQKTMVKSRRHKIEQQLLGEIAKHLIAIVSFKLQHPTNKRCYSFILQKKTVKLRKVIWLRSHSCNGEAKLLT